MFICENTCDCGISLVTPSFSNAPITCHHRPRFIMHMTVAPGCTVGSTPSPRQDHRVRAADVPLPWPPRGDMRSITAGSGSAPISPARHHSVRFSTDQHATLAFWMGSRPNRRLMVIRSREYLSSGEKRAGWAEVVGRPSSDTFFSV